ncbi:MAG: gamma-glutamylcyclotransferase family protein [Nitrospinota bacterium]|nr:gamma-glutamylcyclotransferase family protein [Nitrospinota bacterium]
MTRASQDGRRGGIERALAYPFSIPSGSYVFDGADAIPLDDYFSERGISFSELISGRTPVLAVGSNASPYQLRTKRDCYSLFGEIPVIKARLSGFDVVYSARITSYGSVPATLRPSPGTAVDLFVTFLNGPQLERMDLSEGVGVNYSREKLEAPGDLALERGALPGEVWTYRSKTGFLRIHGDCVALKACGARGRKLPALSQAGVQERLRGLLDGGKTLDVFIRENIGDRAVREARNERLKEWTGEGD